VDDEKKLCVLARWALRFSPIVAPDAPDGCLIDIAGCAHLFGGEQRLVATLASSLARFGFPARIAVAPTFGCARAVARFGSRPITLVPSERIRDALAPLPVYALRMDRATCEALIEMGVERIGQLLDLPSKELAARFDGALLKLIDQALGRVPEAIEPIQEEKSCEVVHTFDGPVGDIEAILTVARTLLIELVEQLRPNKRGVRLLSIELQRVDLASERTWLRLTLPSNNLTHLWSLLRPKLERVNLGYGVEEVRLRAVQSGLVRENQFILWSDQAAQDQSDQAACMGELLDQLIHRLGASAVGRREPVATYVPERAFRYANNGELRADQTRTVHAAVRPSCLFDVPEPIRVIALVPDGPPARIRWHNEERSIEASVGPERIALPWWNGGPVHTRDYFVVEDERGRWLWVFCERSSGQWFVQGMWS